jgi:radical SAM superfamily enzyme YgiQ (UPF0313 family)
MKVLLVVPPMFFGVGVDIGSSYLPPHSGFAYIAASLRERGTKVEIFDSRVEYPAVKRLKKKIGSLKPDVVGITAMTPWIKNASRTADMVKKIDPSIFVVVGGIHATSLPGETLNEFKSFDAAVRGEGEHTMCELVQRLEDDRDFSKVKGIAFRDNGKINVTEPRPWIEDLDSLPFPAWDLLALNKYRARYTFLKKILELPVGTSRGCPYRCIFCNRGSGDRPRFRSIECVLDEIEYWCIGKFGAKKISFHDDSFTLDRKRAIRLCDGLIERGLHEKISWICQTRVDLVDKALLKKMKEANCYDIGFGVESGNPEILSITKKGITLEQARNAFKWTKEVGLKRDVSFMIGNPFETQKTIEDTIRFAFELDPDFFAISIATPFPGTELMKMAEDGFGGLQLRTKNWSRYCSQLGGALSLKQLSRTELERLQRKAYISFYFRPSRIFNMLRFIDPIALPLYALHHLRGIVGISGGGKSENK